MAQGLITDFLRPIGLDPSQGYEMAAAGALQAAGNANALSALQWQRQMAGLQGAQGYVNNLQSLYNSIYSPGGGRPAPGGQPTPGISPSQMQMLSMAPQAPAPQSPGGGGTGLGNLGRLAARSSAAALTGGLSDTGPGKKVMGAIEGGAKKVLGFL